MQRTFSNINQYLLIVHLLNFLKKKVWKGMKNINILSILMFLYDYICTLIICFLRKIRIYCSTFATRETGWCKVLWKSFYISFEKFESNSRNCCIIILNLPPPPTIRTYDNFKQHLKIIKKYYVFNRSTCAINLITVEWNDSFFLTHRSSEVNYIHGTGRSK